MLVSGSIGDHGMTVMSLREGMTFGTTLVSDCAPLGRMVEAIVAAAPNVHVLRDPTRGGLGTTLNEIAAESEVGILLHEAAIPVKDEVRAACEFLGLDPLFSACEGRLICIVPADEADAALAAMKADPHGAGAAKVGEVRSEGPGFVEMETLMGGPPHGRLAYRRAASAHLLILSKEPDFKKEAAEQTFSAASFEFERLVCSHPRITTPASGIKDAYMAASASANFVPGRNGTDMAKGFICSRPGITTS